MSEGDVCSYMFGGSSGWRTEIAGLTVVIE